MACAASQSMLSANSCSFLSQRITKKVRWVKRRNTKLFFSVTNSTSSSEDCNDEECAPDKEVGKVSMEWLAGEKTKVVGTFPPKKKGWTGYVEKDTAGQTNIYSVEPAVYVAESAISSGAAGTSSDGAENTAAIAAGLALVAIASASSILLQVDKKAPVVQSVAYSGPPLSYYITKFQSAKIPDTSVAPELKSSSIVESSLPSEATSEPQNSSIVESPLPSEATQEPTQEPQSPLDVQTDGNADIVSELQVEVVEAGSPSTSSSS